jgi:hypothetical protein
MRKIAIAISMGLLLGAQAMAQQTMNTPSSGNGVGEEPYWTPDADMITRLESRVEMPTFFGQRSYTREQYERYYAGVTVNGRRVIRGRWIVPPNREDFLPTGTHIIDIEDMPSLPGGGCANVTVMYTVDLNLASASCNPAKVDIPPAERPYWTPDLAAIDKLEHVIQAHLDEAHPKLTEVKNFGRYYLGVTIEGKPMIQGSLTLTGTDRSIHLVTSRKDLITMANGQCGNIRFLYDVQSSKLNWLACDDERHIPLQ